MKRSRKRSSRARVLAAFKRESERELSELIRRRLDLPVEKRLNFLRVRRPGGGSYLQSLCPGAIPRGRSAEISLLEAVLQANFGSARFVH